MISLAKFKKPRTEIANYKSFIEIMHALLTVTYLGTKKKGDKLNYLSEATTSMQLVSQTIKLYSSAFEAEPLNLASLCSILKIDDSILKPKKLID